MKYILIFCFIFTSILNAQEDKVFTINTGFTGPTKQFVEIITLEAFKRAKLKINFQGLPNKRALINANNGIDDGDAARIWEISDYYPNLVRVPVQNSKIDIVVLSKKRNIIKDVSDLSKFNVGVIHGMKIAVVLAEKANPLSLYKAKEYKSLIKLLSQDRLDLVITNRIGIYEHREYLEHNKFYILDKPLLTRPLYLHLHKKNSAYILALEKAYTSIHKDGTYEKLYNKFYKNIEEKLKVSLDIIK